MKLIELKQFISKLKSKEEYFEKTSNLKYLLFHFIKFRSAQLIYMRLQESHIK